MAKKKVTSITKIRSKKVEDIVRLGLETSMTHREIAELVGCSRPHVSQVLKRYRVDREMLTTFKKYRADLLALLQEEILSTITPDSLQKESVRNKLTAFGILFDKERLERGQSTQNVSMHTLLDKYNSLEEAESELLSELHEIKNSLSHVEGGRGEQSVVYNDNPPPVDNLQKGGPSEAIELDSDDYDIVIGGNSPDTERGNDDDESKS